LVKITYADQTSTEFRYDGQSRRVGITEKDAARVVTSEKRYLWAEGAQPAEERAADGRTVVKQYHAHAQGEFLPGAAVPLNKVFYTKDHLGSVRELVDGNGTFQTRYDYDLWGGRTKLSGTVESEVGYTGHHHHGKSGLVLTWYRAFDPVTGRWLSRDPIQENGGINLYGYVLNNPVNAVDPLGLLAFGDDINYPGTECNGLYPGEGVGSNGSSFGESLYKAWDLFQKVKAGEINDKYAHCVAHCEISRDLGPEVSDAIGKGKEFADWCKKEVGGGGAGWDSEDEKANKDGRSAAKKTQKSCEVACAEGGYTP
jgi:RHS repeat-associated protein